MRTPDSLVADSVESWRRHNEAVNECNDWLTDLLDLLESHPSAADASVLAERIQERAMFADEMACNAVNQLVAAVDQLQGRCTPAGRQDASAVSSIALLRLQVGTLEAAVRQGLKRGTKR